MTWDKAEGKQGNSYTAITVKASCIWDLFVAHLQFLPVIEQNLSENKT